MPKKPAANLFEALDNYEKRKAKPKKKVIREATVEKARKEEHEEKTGGLSLKFKSVGRRSVPDRIKMSPIPPEHRELVAKYFRFVEYKRPGEEPTPAQHKEHERYRALGFTVDVIDSLPPKD